MIIVMKPNASNGAVKKVTSLIKSKGLTAHPPEGSQVTIVGVTGDKTKLLDTNIEISEDVDRVVAVMESYKLVNKKSHPEDSVIPIGSTHIDPGTMTVMAGPCAIESLGQLLETAYMVKKAGTTFLHGDAYKPCISPYSFQGPEEEGLKYMKAAREATGFDVIREITGTHAIESAVKYVDILQTGARNMQNFELLKEAGKSDTPVLLKRGLYTTINEWLNAAEYIISEDNPDIVLCGRGIHTCEASARNTLDISAVPVIRQGNHPPIIMDPSHITGIGAYMEPLTGAAIAVGAGGLMTEVHPCPVRALSDDSQSLTFDAFEQLMKGLTPYAELSGRTFKAR